MAGKERELSGSDKVTDAPGKRSLPGFIIFTIIALVVVYAVYSLIGLNNPGKEMFNYRHMAMDTDIDLRLQAESRREAEELKDQVFDEIERLEMLFSRSLEGSDIYRVNSRAGIEPVQVSPEVLKVLLAAVEYAAMSGGAFDPTIAPLLDAWGFLGQQYRLPNREEMEEALALVDYTRLEIDREESTVYLPGEGMSLDMGGIAKGYIVDRGLEILDDAGVKHAFLNAGGDIGLLGSKDDGTPWRIGVRHPRENKNAAVISFSEGAVVTSGDYQRSFEEEGVKYHHILDPDSGMPAAFLASVTVTAPTAMLADVLSTAVFVMGPEEGMALVENMEDVEALIYTQGLEMLVSSGLEEKLEILH